MRIGVFYFPVDYGIDIAELATALEQRGFASLYVPEHTHIPTSRKTPFGGGGELPQALLAYARPVRRAVLRRGGDQEADPRHRHLPHPRARPDRHRQMRRQPRPAVGRALHLRHRRRLERRGDGEPRRRLQNPLQADARAHPGDEGAVDRGGGRISRRDGRISIRSGRSPSRSRSRTRRSSSAARPTTRCAASSNIATAGSRARSAAGISATSATGCTRWPTSTAAISRSCSSRCSARLPTPRRSPITESAGIQGAVLEIPDQSRDEILRIIDELRAAARLAGSLIFQRGHAGLCRRQGSDHVLFMFDSGECSRKWSFDPD